MQNVDDDDMPALFAAASVFVFPSFYEGFGIPPLEAMACGTPVIVSRTSSLPEVVGDAAELVDPHDVASIAGALERVLRDPERRGELSAAGLRRATLFDWREEAGKLREIIHRG